jgi:hypothetical protein
MKARGVIGIMGILLGLLLAGGLSPVQAANYLGDFCWQAPDGGVAKFAVNDMGGGHYFLNGRTNKAGGVLDSVAFGNAEVVGSQIYLAITSTGGDTGGTWGAFNRVVLDLATLNGSVEGLEVDHSQTSASPFANGMILSYQGVQTLTFVPCP